MKNNFLLLALLILSIYGFSQETSEKKLIITGVSTQIGVTTNRGVNNEPITTFQELAPKESLVFRDLSGFQQNRFLGVNVIAPTLDARIHFAKRNSDGSTKKWNPEFTLGLGFSAVELLNSSYTKDETFRIDTLESTRTGEEIFIDSINTEIYNFSYEQDVIYLNAGFNVSSNPLRRWRLTIGIESSIGYAIRAQTFLNTVELTQFESSDRSFFRGSIIDANSFESETARNKKSLSARVSLPINISFRLGKDLEKQLSQCIVFIESRPNVTYYSIPELTAEYIFNGNLLGVGFRYEL